MKNGDRVQLVVSRAGFLPGANGIVTIDNLSNNRLSVDIDTRADGSREQPPFPLVSPAKNFAPFAPFAPFAAAAAPARAAAAATAAPAGTPLQGEGGQTPVQELDGRRHRPVPLAPRQVTAMPM